MKQNFQLHFYSISRWRQGIFSFPLTVDRGTLSRFRLTNLDVVYLESEIGILIRRSFNEPGMCVVGGVTQLLYAKYLSIAAYSWEILATTVRTPSSGTSYTPKILETRSRSDHKQGFISRSNVVELRTGLRDMPSSVAQSSMVVMCKATHTHMDFIVTSESVLGHHHRSSHNQCGISLRWTPWT